MHKLTTATILSLFALTASVPAAQATPHTQEEQAPITYGPETVYVEASDGSLVPESELAGYEAWLAEGNTAPEAFETPVEVPAQPGDPVAFETPVPVEPQPGDPVVFGPDTVYVVASDGSLVPDFELAAYEAWLAEGNSIGQPVPAPAPEHPGNGKGHGQPVNLPAPAAPSCG